MTDVVGPLEESDDEDDEARPDGGTTQSGALEFASREAAKNRIKSSVFNHLPNKRFAFIAGAASGSLVTLLTIFAYLLY